VPNQRACRGREQNIKFAPHPLKKYLCVPKSFYVFGTGDGWAKDSGYGLFAKALIRKAQHIQGWMAGIRPERSKTPPGEAHRAKRGRAFTQG
jgi:hypothetical protein